MSVSSNKCILVVHPDFSKALGVPAIFPLLPDEETGNESAQEAAASLNGMLDRLTFASRELSAVDLELHSRDAADFHTVHVIPALHSRTRAVFIIVADGVIISLFYSLFATGVTDGKKNAIDVTAIAILTQIAVTVLLGLFGAFRSPRFFLYYLIILVVSVFFDVRVAQAVYWCVYVLIFVRFTSITSGVHYRYIARRLERLQKQFDLAQSTRRAAKESLLSNVSSFIASSQRLLRSTDGVRRIAGMRPLASPEAAQQLTAATRAASDLLRLLDAALSADRLSLSQPRSSEQRELDPWFFLRRRSQRAPESFGDSASESRRSRRGTDASSVTSGRTRTRSARRLTLFSGLQRSDTETPRRSQHVEGGGPRATTRVSGGGEALGSARPTTPQRIVPPPLLRGSASRHLLLLQQSDPAHNPDRGTMSTPRGEGGSRATGIEVV